MTAAPRFDRASLMPLADWLAVGIAIVLPWSTSATGIFIALWLLVAIPTTEPAALKRELLTPAGGLPVLLWCLGAAGMLWADVGWIERLRGLDGFDRLLLIPLLLTQFRRSGQGGRVACALLISSGALLLASFAMVLIPGLTRPWQVPGIPVHDDIFQGSLFLICGFGVLGYAVLQRRLDRRIVSVLFIGGMLFLANFAFVTISRISVLVVPVMAILLGWRVRRWKGVFGVVILTVALGFLGLSFSPSLQRRMHQTIDEFQNYRVTKADTSVGEHLAFLKESIVIIASAPVFGHGTGSIPQEFRRITSGKEGVSGETTVNPHNQTFAVAIQVGVVGALVLWAMWVAHFALFCELTPDAWLGMVVVTENVVSSIFHSHLFDFNNGWLYVLGVGVLGGTMLGKRNDAAVKLER
jgi:O-antigen ligase